jgi:hypothetical protein
VQQGNALLAQMVARVEQIEVSTGETASVSSSSALRTALNAR